jgi:FkbH-like protein
MYDLSWSDAAAWRGYHGAEPIPPPPADRAVAAAGLLLWEEHCVECAVPVCYATCSLYVARKDGKCARFAYGVFANPQVQGLFPFGADIFFRRWGKLEARCNGFPKMAPLDTVRRYARLQRRAERVVNAASDLLQPINPRRRLNGLQTYARNALLLRQSARREDIDAFYVKLFSPNPEEFDMQLEFHQDCPVFRDVIRVRPGWNEKIIPVETMGVEAGKLGRVLLAMGNEQSARLVFTWLDFVRFEEPAPDGVAEPAARVKCVAWDLDNTLWDGVIGDVGPENIIPNERALALVRELDRRGIVQTIASKNNYEIAWAKVEELGLADYLLYPAIHWGPKSESLRSIAAEFNINVDTFALIDDSAFERAEVRAVLPQVRTYDVEEVDVLLARTEFDIPITEAASLRRLSYLVEARRKRVGAVWSGDRTGFLRSCELVLHIAPPSDAEQPRCLELLQRTNQLNLSTRRYAQDDFARLLTSPQIECFALRCEDRFGEYGLVGFAAIDVSGPAPALRDFVLSCRVAQKMVEETFLRWYARRAQQLGADRLQATFVSTARNAPLRDALGTLPFVVRHSDESGELLEFVFDGPVEIPDVLRIDAAS